MATRHDTGGASAPPNVLPFPQRNKGRIRRSHSLDAAGELILNHMAQHGEAQPVNVARLTPLPEPTPIVQTPELLLAVSIWASVPKAKKADILSQLRFVGFTTRCPHALALVAMLDGGRAAR